MFTAILDIIAAIVKPLSKLWMRKQDQADDPKNISEKQKNENREAIADGTAGDVLMHRLNRLPDSQDKGPGPKQ